MRDLTKIMTSKIDEAYKFILISCALSSSERNERGISHYEVLIEKAYIKFEIKRSELIKYLNEKAAFSKLMRKLECDEHIQKSKKKCSCAIAH